MGNENLNTQAIDWGPVPPPPPFRQIAEAIHAALVKATGAGSSPNTTASSSPPPFQPTPAKSVPEPKQVNDSVNVARNRLATNYNPVQLKGFSENRPEILCVTDFEPAYRASASTRQLGNNRSLLPVGEKLKVMLALARLRNYNIKQLMETLREDKDAAKIIDDIEREYDTKIENAIDDIRALTSLAVRLEKARDALNVRKSQAKISQKMASRLSFTSAPMGYVDILEELGFNRVNIADFSNTKILMQIINDYNAMLTNYSPGLLGIENDIRKFDDDPFDIIENLFDPKQEPQVLDNLRQQAAAGESYSEIMDSFFNNMTSEQVFISADNRVKFLANFIAKELVVSAGLGRSSTKAALQNTFAAPNEGNVFDNILGTPGGDVLEAPHAGKNAITGFMNVLGADNTLVLPFESPLTEDDDESFVTGTEFFIDSIVQGQARLDPTPLANFVGKMGTATSQARNIIERRLLSFRGNSRSKRPTGASIFGSALEVFNDMYSSTRNESSDIADKRFTLLSLMKLAVDNPRLKWYLYQYTLAIGINRGYNTRKNSGGKGDLIYRQIVRSDIQYVEDFPVFNESFAGTGENDIYKLKHNLVPIEAIDFLIMKITVEVTNIVGTSSFSIQKAGGDTKNVSFAVINDALRETTGERSIFQAINSLAGDLINGARRGYSGSVNDGYFVDTTTFRTRFNFVSPAVLIGLVFEMFMSVSSMTGADITSTTIKSTVGTSTLSIQGSIHDRAAFSNAVTQILSGGSGDKNAVSPVTSNTLLQGTAKLARQTNRKVQKFDAIMADLIDEDNFLATVTSFIFSYMDYIKSQTQPLVSMMRQSNNKKSASAVSVLQRLQSVQKRVDSDDIFATLNPAQIALSIRQAVEIQRSMRFSSGRNVSAFSDPEFLDPGAEEMLFALLREPRFKEGRATNLKILTVGLPTGFKSSLRSVEIEDESTPGPEREADVININVYRRDLEFEDIVFKPMSFTFELSRFTQVSPRTRVPRGKRLLGVSNSIASAGKVKTFNIQVDEDFRWSTYGTAGGLNGRSETILNVAQAPGYDWMDEVDKKRMFQNHIINYFLNLYLKLLTDIDFSESTFLVNNTVAQVKADKRDRERFVNLMLKRVKQVAGRTVSLSDLRNADPMMNKLLDKLENNDDTTGVTGKVETSMTDLSADANIEISENVVNFMKSFSPDSFLTGADVTSTRLVSPKLFERIFHVAVDLDEFDIDVRQTRATKAGREMYRSAEFRSASYQSAGRVRMKPRSSKEGEQIMSELFINVESKLVQESSSDEASSVDDEKIRLEISGAGKRTKPNLKFNRGIK